MADSPMPDELFMFRNGYHEIVHGETDRSTRYVKASALIEALPELLAALIGCRSRFREVAHGFEAEGMPRSAAKVRGWISQIEAVIAKAERP